MWDYFKVQIICILSCLLVLCIFLPEDGVSSVTPKHLPDYMASHTISQQSSWSLPWKYWTCLVLIPSCFAEHAVQQWYTCLIPWEISNLCMHGPMVIHALQTCNYIFDIIPDNSHERVITSIVPHPWQRRQYFPRVSGGAQNQTYYY